MQNKCHLTVKMYFKVGELGQQIN